MKMLKTKKKRIIVFEYRNDLLIYVYIFKKFGLFLVLPKKKYYNNKMGDRYSKYF